ncbi:MAG: Smr/MutS family protein [Myxococcota bacterium]|nr:Smr/MutS family protein [Myxococcota bacterium]
MSDPERDASQGRDTGEEPVVVPIEQSIDLHSFLPRDVLGVVDAYLEAARERGFREVRLIHGRGKGVQRARIQQQLARDPRVEHYADAPGERGGWGATIAWLRLPTATADEP